MLHSRTNEYIQKYNNFITESMSYDVPPDTIISDILESYYSNIIDNNQLNTQEKTFIDLIHESLSEVLENKLDYRNNSFHDNLEKVNEFIETSTSKFTLLQPISDIVNIMSNYDLMENKHFNNHKEVGLTEDIDLRMVSIQESDLFDFVMELFMNGFIPDSYMNQYNLALKEYMESTSRDLMESSRDMSTSDNNDNPSISPYITDSNIFLFPNEYSLNDILSKFKNEYFKHIIIESDFLTQDDILSFIDDLDNSLDELPDGFTAYRLVYDIVNDHPDHIGHCTICNNPTKWNEKRQKYERLCGNPKCYDEVKKIYQKRMIKVYNKTSLMDDPDHLEKMLAGRKISGKYKWSDDREFTYTGTYEKNALEFMDKVLEIPSIKKKP